MYIGASRTSGSMQCCLLLLLQTWLRLFRTLLTANSLLSEWRHLSQRSQPAQLLCATLSRPLRGKRRLFNLLSSHFSRAVHACCACIQMRIAGEKQTGIHRSALVATTCMSACWRGEWLRFWWRFISLGREQRRLLDETKSVAPSGGRERMVPQAAWKNTGGKTGKIHSRRTTSNSCPVAGKAVSKPAKLLLMVVPLLVIAMQTMLRLTLAADN